MSGAGPSKHRTAKKKEQKKKSLRFFFRIDLMKSTSSFILFFAH